MSYAEEVIKLREEAAVVLTNLIGTPRGFNPGVERFIECIISAAVLSIAGIQEKAISKRRVY